jgi:hypothetical protein
MRPIRVIHCFPGSVGAQVVERLVASPNFELVGALVHSPDKAGRDIGEVCGIGPVGITATADVDEILAIEADCAVYNGASWDTDFHARMLASGKNLYSGWGGWFPEGEEREKLEAACQAGGTSLIAGGNIPGLVNDVLPLFVSGYSDGVRRVWSRENNPVHKHTSPYLLDRVGIGRTRENVLGDDHGTYWMWFMKQSAEMVAAGLGVKLDRFERTLKDVALAPEDIVLPVCGMTVKKGHVAGVRYVYTGWVEGEPWYVAECDLPVALGLGQDWRQRDDEPNFEVRIEGEPNITATMSVDDPGDSRLVNRLNAARAINMIPYVVAAPVGCHSVLDVPMIRANFADPHGKTAS